MNLDSSYSSDSSSDYEPLEQQQVVKNFYVENMNFNESSSGSFVSQSRKKNKQNKQHNNRHHSSKKHRKNNNNINHHRRRQEEFYDHGYQPKQTPMNSHFSAGYNHYAGPSSAPASYGGSGGHRNENSPFSYSTPQHLNDNHSLPEKNFNRHESYGYNKNRMQQQQKQENFDNWRGPGLQQNENNYLPKNARRKLKYEPVECIEISDDENVEDVNVDLQPLTRPPLPATDKSSSQSSKTPAIPDDNVMIVENETTQIEVPDFIDFGDYEGSDDDDDDLADKTAKFPDNPVRRTALQVFQPAKQNNHIQPKQQQSHQSNNLDLTDITNECSGTSNIIDHQKRVWTAQEIRKLARSTARKMTGANKTANKLQKQQKEKKQQQQQLTRNAGNVKIVPASTRGRKKTVPKKRVVPVRAARLDADQKRQKQDLDAENGYPDDEDVTENSDEESDDDDSDFKGRLDEFVGTFLPDAYAISAANYKRLHIPNIIPEESTTPQLIFLTTNTKALAKALIQKYKKFGVVKVGSTIIRVIKSGYTQKIRYYLNDHHSHLTIDNFISFYAHQKDKVRYGECIPFVLAFIFGFSCAYPGDRGKEYGKVAANETNLIGTYVEPYTETEEDEIFLKLLRIDQSHPDKLRCAFAVYQILVEAGFDCVFCAPCMRTYYQEHAHNLSSHENPPLNYIDAQRPLTIPNLMLKDIKLALMEQKAADLDVFADSFKDVFNEGIKCGKPLQSLAIFQCEKTTFNAKAFKFWFQSRTELKQVSSKKMLLKSFDKRVSNNIYFCSACRFANKGKPGLLRHAAKCTHNLVATEMLPDLLLRKLRIEDIEADEQAWALQEEFLVEDSD